MDYDYRNGKKRIMEILNDSTSIQEVDNIPNDQEFTFDNGYYGWVTSVFVDIRESTKLFSENRKSSTAKIIRCFTSEIIEILSDDNNLREIGIRGDCVYAIYSSNSHQSDLEILDKTFYINTYLDMLNKILVSKNMKQIKAGIGISTSKDLVVKAGRKGIGINSKVWIGKAVTYASKLSGRSKKDYDYPILMNDNFYNSIIEIYQKSRNYYKDDRFSKLFDNELGNIYGCSLTKTDFSNWIEGGMK